MAKDDKSILIAINIECTRAKEVTELKNEFVRLTAWATKAGVAMDKALAGSANGGAARALPTGSTGGGGAYVPGGTAGYPTPIIQASKYTPINSPAYTARPLTPGMIPFVPGMAKNTKLDLDPLVEAAKQKNFDDFRANRMGATALGQEQNNSAAEQALVAKRIKAESNLNAIIGQRQILLDTEATKLQINTEKVIARNAVGQGNPQAIAAQELARREGGLLRTNVNTQLSEGNLGLEEKIAAAKKKQVDSSNELDALSQKGVAINQANVEYGKKIVKSTAETEIMKRNTLGTDQLTTNSMSKKTAQLESQARVLRENVAIKVQELKATAELNRAEHKAEKDYLKANPQDAQYLEKLTPFTTVARRLILWTSATMVMIKATQALSQAWKATVQLEDSMAELKKVMPQGTDFEYMRKGLFDIAKAYGVTAQEAIKAGIIWAQQGFSAKDTLELTKNALLGMNSANLTATQSTNVLTSAYHTFGITATGTRQILDGIMRVQADYAVSASDLADAIQKIGPAVADMGGDANLLNGVIAAIVTQTRRTGTAAATSFKTIISRFTEPATIKAFEAIGISIRKNATEYRALGDILDDLGSKWKSLPEGVRVDLAKQVGGVRQFVDFLAMMDRYDIVTEASTKSANAWGDAQRANDIQIATMSRRLNQLGTATTQLTTSTFSESVWGGVKLIVRSLTALVNGLNLIPGGIGGIVALTTAIGLLRLVMTKLHISSQLNIKSLKAWTVTQMELTGATNFTTLAMIRLKAVAKSLMMTTVWTAALIGVTALIEKIWDAHDAQKALNDRYKELHSISQDTKDIISGMQLYNESPVGSASGFDVQKALAGVAQKMREATVPARDLKDVLSSTKIGKGSLLDLYPEIDKNSESLRKFTDDLDKAMLAEKDSFKPLLDKIGQVNDALSEVFSSFKDNGGKLRFDSLTKTTQDILGMKRMGELNAAQWNVSPFDSEKETLKKFAAIDKEKKEITQLQSTIKGLFSEPLTPETSKQFEDWTRKLLDPQKKVLWDFDLSGFPVAQANLEEFKNIVGKITTQLGVPVDWKVNLDAEGKITTLEMIRKEIYAFYVTDLDKALARLDALNESQNIVWGPNTGVTGFDKRRALLDEYLKSLGAVEKGGLELALQLAEVDAQIRVIDEGLKTQKTDKGLPIDTAQTDREKYVTQREELQKQLAQIKGLTKAQLKESVAKVKALADEINVLPVLIRSYELLGDTIKNAAENQNQLAQASADVATNEVKTKNDLATKYLSSYYENNVNMQQAIQQLTLRSAIDTENKITAIKKQAIDAELETNKKAAEEQSRIKLEAINRDTRVGIEAKDLANKNAPGELKAEIDKLTANASAGKQILDIQNNSTNAQASLNTEYSIGTDHLKNMRDAAENLRGVLRDTVGDLSNISDMITNPTNNNFFKKLGPNVANKMFEKNSDVLFKAIVPDSIGKLFMDEQKSMPVLVADATRSGAYEGIVDGLNTHFGNTSVDMGTAGLSLDPTTVSQMGKTFIGLGINGGAGGTNRQIGAGLNILEKEVKDGNKKGLSKNEGLSKNDRLAMAIGAMGGDIAGSIVAQNKGLETNYADVGSGIGAMLGLVNPALGIAGGLIGGLIGGSFGTKPKTEEVLREIADNTSVLKDMPQGLFNIPANFTLPPAAWGGSGMGNTIQGDINIVINPGTSSPGDIATAVKREIEGYFNVGSRVGSKVGF